MHECWGLTVSNWSAHFPDKLKEECCSACSGLEASRVHGPVGRSRASSKLSEEKAVGELWAVVNTWPVVWKIK